MWLLPVLPFLTMRIWVVMRSDMVSVWLMTPTFLPCDDWSIASASMTVESVSGSSVPKPSSMKRFSKDRLRDDRADSPRASPS